jgi:hypothetical protein
MQFAADFFSNSPFYRSTNGSGTTGWNRIALYDNAYSSNLRATLYYDNDNTAYYTDPASGSVLNSLILGGDLTVGNNGTSSNIYMQDTDEGSRRIHCNSNRIGFLTQGDSWGSFCHDDGWWQSDSSVRAPIFYDSNDTGYYTDPNSYSNVWRLNAQGQFSTDTGGAGIYLGAQNVTTSNGLWINWHSDGDVNYRIGKPAGAWTQPLEIRFYTGIRHKASASYGGHQFIDSNTNGVVFDMANGGSFTRSNVSFYAPIMYDNDNTAYYGNFGGTSVMSAIALGGSTSVPQGVMWINGDIWTTGNSRRLAFSTDGSGDGTPNGSIRCDGTGAGDVVIQNWSGGASNDNFWVFGASRDAACAGNITAYYSDERLKTKTGNLDNALAKVMSLEGFTYIENELARSVGYNNTKQQVGLSAQKVKAVLPEAVALAPFDYERQEDGTMASKSGEDYLTVDYSRLVPLLIEAIKELTAKVEELEAK